MISPATIPLSSTDLAVEVAELGAELVRLRDSDGRDLLWDGDPVFWSGRAPLLFPMVGRARGDRIRVEGVDYDLPQHGFARGSRFALVAQSRSSCTLRLSESEVTLARYPFRFSLDVVYTVQGRRLSVEALLTNDDARPLPASFGFHPAFLWPLPGGAPRESHALRFEHPEHEPIRRPVDGLLGHVAQPTPVMEAQLPLHDGLFRDGALVFDRLASQRVDYGAPGGVGIEVAFPGMPHLGLWTKPGAPFLCIEPWQGFASPEDFEGEFAERPGVVRVAPGETRQFAMTITVRPPAP